MRLQVAAARLMRPDLLLVVMWAAYALFFFYGPILYRDAPGLAASVWVIVGITIFLLGHSLGLQSWAQDRRYVRPPADVRNAVGVFSLVGIVGIALVAADRLWINSPSSELATLLRCAPHLVELIVTERGPLLYVGYLAFSAAYPATALFLFNAEKVRGIPALLAQAAVVSPIGYALLYSGRMPILLLCVLVAGTLAARAVSGKTIMPRGHMLLPKLVLLVLGLVLYNQWVWSERRAYCTQSETTIVAVEEIAAEKGGQISAAEAASVVQSGRTVVSSPPKEPAGPGRLSDFQAVMNEAWNVAPRPYVLDLPVPDRLIVGGISSLFYVTHGLMTVERIVQHREQFGIYGGLYQIGVLSPFFRIVAPELNLAGKMGDALRTTGVYGFFPTVWGAAYVDFGIFGGMIYIFCWGFAGGWSYRATRDGNGALAPLVLSFVLGSILLSTINGPLGLANSALVAGWIVMVGLALETRLLPHLRLPFAGHSRAQHRASPAE